MSQSKISSLGRPPADPKAWTRRTARLSADDRASVLHDRGTAGLLSASPEGHVQLLHLPREAVFDGEVVIVGLEGNRADRPLVVSVPEFDAFNDVVFILPSTLKGKGAELVRGSVWNGCGFVKAGSLPRVLPVPFGHSLIEGDIWDERVYSALCDNGPHFQAWAKALRSEFPLVNGGPLQRTKPSFLPSFDASFCLELKPLVPSLDDGPYWKVFNKFQKLLLKHHADARGTAIGDSEGEGEDS